MPTRIVVRFARDRHGIIGKYRRGMERGTVVFAAVHAMTQADTVWAARCCDLNVATGTAARHLIHVETARRSEVARLRHARSVVSAINEQHLT